MPFLYPEAGESGPIARAQAVSTPNVLCQPSSYTPDSSFHTTNSPAHPPRAHKLRFFDVRGPEYGPYSPWRFRLVDQQPASGLLDLGILVPSSAILPLAMLEPKYSMVSRLLCSLCALSVSPNRSPCSNDPAQLRIVMVLDQNSPTACMERRPVVFTVPLERRLKKICSGKLSKHTFTCICIMFSLFDQIEKSYKEKWWRTRLYDWLNYGARGISIGKNFVDVDL